MDREVLIAAHREAAEALVAGQRLAERAVKLRHGGDAGVDRPSGRALGAVLADPAHFWAAAVTVEASGDGDTVEALAQANKLAAAKLAANDFDFVRASLIGQATWLSALAVKLTGRAEDTKRPDQVGNLIRLALAAQRQAAQALCSAAALVGLHADAVIDDEQRIVQESKIQG